jgi:hypothetical protein
MLYLTTNIFTTTSATSIVAEIVLRISRHMKLDEILLEKSRNLCRVSIANLLIFQRKNVVKFSRNFNCAIFTEVFQMYSTSMV